MKTTKVNEGQYKCEFRGIVTIGNTRTQAMCKMMKLVRMYKQEVMSKSE